MNSRNYSYIRTMLNGSYITDDILNRVFCLSKEHDTPVSDWCKLDDEWALIIIDWIKVTEARVRIERNKARQRAWRYKNMIGRAGYKKAVGL